MRRKLVLGSVLVLVAAGVAAYVAIDPNAQFDKRWAAEKVIRARMRDPDSAKFSDVTIIKVGGEPYAMCGYINGKNGYGAYAGPRRFHMRLGEPATLFIVPGREERGGEDYSNVEGMMETLCSNDADAVAAAANGIMATLKSR